MVFILIFPSEADFADTSVEVMSWLWKISGVALRQLAEEIIIGGGSTILGAGSVCIWELVSESEIVSMVSSSSSDVKSREEVLEAV